MPEYDEETQAKITGTFYLLIIDALCSWGVVLTIILIFATAADQARKEFNDAESATRDTEKEIRCVCANTWTTTNVRDLYGMIQK